MPSSAQCLPCPQHTLRLTQDLYLCAFDPAVPSAWGDFSPLTSSVSLQSAPLTLMLLRGHPPVTAPPPAGQFQLVATLLPPPLGLDHVAV